MATVSNLLSKVKSTSLFEGASINDYLELLVCQRERSQCIIVLGSEGCVDCHMIQLAVVLCIGHVLKD